MTTLRAIILLALVGLLIGCQSAPEPEGSSRRAVRRQSAISSGTAPTTISWSFWGTEWEVQINRRVARAFEAENPSIKIELIHQPWEAYFLWIEEQWRLGTAPDVMFLNNIRGYASRGHLEPLDTYIIRDRFSIEDFYPRLLELFNFQNYYYGLPRDNDTKVIFVNRELFADAGLEVPRSGWTWSDLRRLARQLTLRDATGQPLQYGFAYEAEVWWRIWVWQNGGDILDDPLFPSRVRLDEPEAIDAIQFLADLTNRDRVTPPADVLSSSGRITQLFREGRLAMAFGGHGKVPALAEEADLDWDVVPLPVGRRRVNLAGGAGYTIWSGSQKKDAAWALIRFLESPKGQALFAESGLIVPARRSIREDNIFVRQQPYSVQVFADESEYGRPNLNIPQASEINRLTDQTLASVWRGERSAVEAVTGLMAPLRFLVGR